MKKVFLLLTLSIMSLNNAISQSKEEALNAKEITWLGLDFTRARFIGHEGFHNAEELVNRRIPEWNRLMAIESSKYSIHRYFLVDIVHDDFRYVHERNTKIDPVGIILSGKNSYSISESDIQEMVSEYNVDGDGYAILFIIESFNKRTVKGTMWVTYFHIPSKKVVHAKRYSNLAQGFGLRNYWAKTIHRTMVQCQKNFRK